MKSFKILSALIIISAGFSGCSDSSSVAKSDKLVGAVKLVSQLPFDPSSTPSLTSGGACNFDSIDGKDRDLASFSMKKGQQLHVVGWAAVSVEEEVLPTDVVLALQNNQDTKIAYYAATAKEKREDVALYFKKPALVDSGFNTLIDLSDLVTGQYMLKIVQHKEDKNIVCMITKIINVIE